MLYPKLAVEFTGFAADLNLRGNVEAMVFHLVGALGGDKTEIGVAGIEGPG